MALSLRLATLAVAIMLGGAAWAYPLKPGLWEMQTKMEAGDGALAQAMAAMEKQLAALPEGQRKMMEEMLAKQGVGITGLGADGVRMRHCLSPQMVAEEKLPFERQGEGCERTLVSRSDSEIRFTLSCREPPARGEGEVHFVNPGAYTSRFTLEMEYEGRQERIQGRSESRWLADECGDIKPLE